MATQKKSTNLAGTQLRLQWLIRSKKVDFANSQCFLRLERFKTPTTDHMSKIPEIKPFCLTEKRSAIIGTRKATWIMLDFRCGFSRMVDGNLGYLWCLFRSWGVLLCRTRDIYTAFGRRLRLRPWSVWPHDGLHSNVDWVHYCQVNIRIYDPFGLETPKRGSKFIFSQK